MILAIDPGSEKSGWVQLRDGDLRSFGIDSNEDVLDVLLVDGKADTLVIEHTPPYAMQTKSGGHYVPRQVFETAFYCGRLAQEWMNLRGELPALVPRRDVLKHITGKGARVGDKEVRAALIDRWGGKDTAIGKKASPGPLYGVSSHVWAALAVGLTYYETRSESR